MKNMRVLRVCILGAGMAALHAQGALLVTGQNPSSPYYADFTSSHLAVSYTYSAGIGTFTASSSTGANEAYTDGPESPGTGNGTSKAYNATGFNGSYSLTATIQQISGLWEVTGGALNIYGDLIGGTGHAGDLLLSANLKTGAGTIGYGASGTKEFDFLFGVSGGNSSILRDFFGVGGQGAIILNTGNYNTLPGHVAYQDLAHSFSNLGSGTADTFVPEPSAYPLAGSVMALLGLAVARRNKTNAAN
jgi:hypothetical protein